MSPLRLLPLIVFFLLALALALGLFKHEQPAKPSSPLIGKSFPAISIPRLDNPATLLTNADFAGYPVLINLYASWCAPCRAELPVLVQLAGQNIIRIYGIAWRDSPKALSAVLQENGNPFQATGLDNGGKLTVSLGLNGIPETYLLDATGHIVFKHSGPLTQEAVDQELLPLIAQLNEGSR